jgi:hypothetical protein
LTDEADRGGYQRVVHVPAAAAVDHARAVDCIAAARRAVTSMLSTWDHPDQELRASLHTAAVINYARPFTSNRTETGPRSRYRTNHLQGAQGYDGRLHDHLLDLRDKLIAHHDSEYLQARLLHEVVNLSLRPKGAELSVPVGVSVIIQALQSIADRAVVDGYAVHFDAVITAINSVYRSELHEMVRVAMHHPREALENPTETEVHRLFEGAPTSVGVGKLPRTEDVGLAQLSNPNLTMHADGYIYRTVVTGARWGGSITARFPDGTELNLTTGADATRLAEQLRSQAAAPPNDGTPAGGS